ncbi:MAG: hypothetical protein H0W83_18030 [Planctomycetes bacterium]|nr:hypothetical protein [Planctomycetota bacterium]
MTDLTAAEALAVAPLLVASFFFGFYPAPISDRAGRVAEELGAAARVHSLTVPLDAKTATAPAPRP